MCFFIKSMHDVDDTYCIQQVHRSDLGYQIHPHICRGSSAVYLEFSWNEEVLLAQSVNSGVLLSNLHLDWINQAGTLQLGHLVGHGGAEQLCPALLQ